MENYIPKSTQRIASKREERIRSKALLSRTRQRLRNVWWARGIFEIVPLLLLSAVNIYLIHKYMFLPAQNIDFSAPIVPLFTNLMFFSGIQIHYKVQWVVALFYLLLPVSLYFFIRAVTDRKILGFYAALLISLPFFPFALSRIQSSFFGADAAHIVSLPITLLALIGLLWFVRIGRISNFIISVLGMVAVALTSPFGLLTYGIFAGILTFSEMLLGEGRVRMLRFLAVVTLSIGLVSFWYNPGFLFWFLDSTIFVEIRFMISKLIPISLFAVPILLITGYLLFDRKPNLQPLFLATFYTLAFATITTVAGGFFPSSPSRYVPELGISLAFLVSYLLVFVTDYFRKNNKIGFVRKFNLRIEYSLLISLYVVSLLVIAAMEERLYRNITGVLGVWTQTGKTQIWHSRQNADRLDHYAGYTISMLSLGVLIYLIHVYKTKEKY